MLVNDFREMSTKELIRRNIGFHGDSCSIKQWQLVGFVFEDKSFICEEEFSGDALRKSVLGCKAEKVCSGILCGFIFGRGCKFSCERGLSFGFGRG
jgi:hypothetical protein